MVVTDDHTSINEMDATTGWTGDGITLGDTMNIIFLEQDNGIRWNALDAGDNSMYRDVSLNLSDVIVSFTAMTVDPFARSKITGVALKMYDGSGRSGNWSRWEGDITLLTGLVGWRVVPFWTGKTPDTSSGTLNLSSVSCIEIIVTLSSAHAGDWRFAFDSLRYMTYMQCTGTGNDFETIKAHTEQMANEYPLQCCEIEGITISLRALFRIGDGSTTTVFTDTLKSIDLRANDSGNITRFRIRNNATLTLGILSSGAVSSGCSIFCSDEVVDINVMLENGGTLNLYACSVFNTGYLHIGNDTYTISGTCQGTKFSGIKGLKYYSTVYILKDVIIEAATETYALEIYADPTTDFENITIINANTHGLLLDKSGGLTVWAINISGSGTDDIRIDAAGTYNMINCYFDNAKVNDVTPANTWTLYKKYTFDTTIKEAGLIQNARVIMWDQASVQQFNVLTNASGVISQQEVAAYDLVNSGGTVTPTDNNPHKLRIYKYGYHPAELSYNHLTPISGERYLTIDDYITESSEATVEAYTGITVNYGTETITISEDHTLAEVYDWCQDNIADNPKEAFDKIINTADGRTFIFEDNWTFKTTPGNDLTATEGVTFIFGGTGGMELNGGIADGLTVDGSLLLDAVMDLNGMTVTDGLTMDTAGTYTFSNCVIDEVINTSGGAITINATNTTITLNTGPNITINNSVNITITVKDENTLLENARVRIEADSGGSLPAYKSTTLARSGSTVTATCNTHGLVTGDYVIIRGAIEDEYNGDHQITYINANSYSYTVSGSPATPATGTITTTARIMNELTLVTGIAAESFSFGAPQPIIGVVRKSTGSPYYKQGQISGSITTGGFATTVVMVLDE